MSKIPKKLRAELAANPFYRVCARKGLHGHECAGRITWEHAIVWAGKQVQKQWAIIPLCAKAHSVDQWQDCGDLDKQCNVWIALSRATVPDILEISRAVDYMHELERLVAIYGPYTPPATSVAPAIEYPWLHEKSTI